MDLFKQLAQLKMKKKQAKTHNRKDMFCACPGSRIRTLKTTKYTINHPAYKNTGIIKAMNLQETSKKKENLKQYYKPVTYLQKFISQKSKHMEDKVF